jgi:1-acyl-sn-glycerol-3-phosphate acyltransferase
MVEFLQQQDTIVGIHPEGTRGKGDDPYTFLPAQPGVGKVALLAKPTVIPLFVNGLGNKLLQDITRSRQKGSRRQYPVIEVFGAPIDYTDLQAEKPRPTLYKKATDRFMAEIKRLSEREKVLRADIGAGRIPDDDPRWIENRNKVGLLYAREA